MVSALEQAGHEVAWVRTAAPGISDDEVLAWAAREDRILVTFDKDFGKLAARAAKPEGGGVILIRVPAPRSEAAGRQFAERIKARQDWFGNFSVIEPARVRMRRLPGG